MGCSYRGSRTANNPSNLSQSERNKYYSAREAREEAIMHVFPTRWRIALTERRDRAILKNKRKDWKNKQLFNISNGARSLATRDHEQQSKGSNYISLNARIRLYPVNTVPQGSIMESMQRWNHLTQATGSCVQGRTKLTTKPRSFVPAKKKTPTEQSINQYFILCLFTSRWYLILDKNKNNNKKQQQTNKTKAKHIIIIYTNFPTGLWTINLTILVITLVLYKISLTLL